ncbi:MAG: phytoene desaturase family protein [Jiangellaceae bacterium]
MARVVVVGAGLGGLAAAARLADLGHGVTVLEQAASVGGTVGTYARDGYRFDTGPTSFTLPAVFHDLFRTTGRPLEREIDLAPVDPSCRYRFADGVEVDLPNASRAGAIRALDEALGPGAGAQWHAILQRGERTWRAVRGPVLDSPPSARDLIRIATSPATLRAVGVGLPLRKAAARHRTDPRLRAMLAHYAADAGADPRRSTFPLLPYVEHTFGTWHVRGGVHRLAEAIRDRAVARGAAVRTGVEVDHVLSSGGRTSGVRLAGDGADVAADVVVADVDASHLYRDLVAPHRRRPRSDHTGGWPSVFTMLLALHGRTPGLPHRTVLFPADLDAEFDSLFGTTRGPVDDPTVYVSAPDDPGMRPDQDSEAWTVHVRAPPHGVDTPGAVDWTPNGIADTYADQVLAVLAARGLEVRDRVAWRVVRTPRDVFADTRWPGGAIGPSVTDARSVLRRPANGSPVPGLFLVGASTRPGAGLPFVAWSAHTVADLVGRA